MPTMPRRSKEAPYRIQLALHAKAVLEDLCDGLGIQQKAMMTRIIEWFASQPEEVQAAVLGLYPRNVEAEIARLLLGRHRD